MDSEKIILGIDPGTMVMGYGIIREQGRQMELITMGVINLKKLENQALKLKKIFERVLEIINEYHPDELAIEAPFFGKNVQSMLKLGRAQGVAMAAAQDHQAEHHRQRKCLKGAGGQDGAFHPQDRRRPKVLRRHRCRGCCRVPLHQQGQGRELYQTHH